MYGLAADLTINTNDPNFGVIQNPNAIPPASAGMNLPPSTVYDAEYARLLAAGNPNPTCTCVAGSCMESGDSCSSPAAAKAPGALTLPSWLPPWALWGIGGIFVFGLFFGGGRRR